MIQDRRRRRLRRCSRATHRALRPEGERRRRAAQRSRRDLDGLRELVAGLRDAPWTAAAWLRLAFGLGRLVAPG
jgi:hypothetical protein